MVKSTFRETEEHVGVGGGSSEVVYRQPLLLTLELHPALLRKHQGGLAGWRFVVMASL